MEDGKMGNFKVERKNKYPFKVWNTIFIGLRARDYKFPQVLAEFVDNSIAQRYISSSGKLEPLKIEITIDHEIRIFDDGNGQNEQGTSEVMNLGKLTDKSLSKFGLGIKQAGIWLGRHVWIFTKKLGEEEVHSCELNLKDIEKNPQLLNNWEMEVRSFSPYVVNGEDLSKKDKHFFEIRITDLENIPSKSDIEYIKRSFGSVFVSYLRNGVEILINGNKVKKNLRPELVDLPSYKSKKVEFNLPDKGIKGWWGITLAGLAGRSRNYGMDTYFNGRLVKGSDTHIIGIGSDNAISPMHPDFWRLDGEIFFDSPCVFDNNIVSNKNAWVEDKTYESIQKLLNEIIAVPYRKEVRFVSKAQKENEKTLTYEKIGETAPVFLKKGFPDLIQPRKEYRRAKEDETPLIDLEVPIRTQSDPTNKSKEINEDTGYNGKQNPSNPHLELRGHIPIYIKGIKYDIKIIPSLVMNEKDPRYICTQDEKNNVLTITINENRAEIKEMDVDSEMDFILEWIVESILVIQNKSYDIKGFISDREDVLSKINISYWKETVENIVWLEEKKKKTKNK